jgi:tRNA threonylcarbamoyladenosine biosynthesis protein TsaE
VSRIATSSREQTQELGRLLAALLLPGDVLLLSGDLGAGKTQLTKGIAEGLGVAEPVTSPTFNILLVHEGRLTLNHFDLYRLDAAEQLDDLDYWGVLESGGVAVVEWGDRFPDALPDGAVQIALRITGDDDRVLDLDEATPRGSKLAAALSAALPADCSAGRPLPHTNGGAS